MIGNLRLVVGMFLLMVTGACMNLSKGLAAYYPLDGNAEDHGPNRLHGINHGARPAAGVNGKETSAYQFDGNEYIEVLDDSKLNIENNFTLTAWIFLNKAKSMGSRIIDKSVGSTAEGYLLDTYDTELTGRKIRLFCGEPWKYRSTTPLKLNQWYFVAATFSDGTGRIYLDGKLDMVNTGIMRKIVVSHAPLRIGFDTGQRNGNDFDDSFVGKIDEVRIYKRVLQPRHIQELYESGKE